MSVRRRRIKERVERNRRWLEGHEALTLSLHGIQQAITAARARGETEVTDRFLQEAFLATRAPASSEETGRSRVYERSEMSDAELKRRYGDCAPETAPEQPTYYDPATSERKEF